MGLPSTVFSRLEQFIRNGQAPAAAEKVKALIRRKLSRADRQMLSAFAYRCGLAESGLRLLHATVRPTGGKPGNATDGENAIYAQCLIRVGSIEEALELLKKTDAAKAPLALFARAAAHMGLWDYESALPFVREYLKSRGLNPYQRLVAQTNLAACYVSTGRYRESTPLLRQLLYETSLRKLGLLHANALELSAQNYYVQKKWTPALSCLDRAAPQGAGAETRDVLFVQKWRALISLARDGVSKGDLSALGQVRRLAGEQRDWETVRECDAYDAKFTHDQKLFWTVFFATPYPTYRASLLRENPEFGNPPAFHWWDKGSREKKKQKRILDLQTGQGSYRGDALNPNRLLHRLLLALTLDLYRPVRGATLFTQLFPEEFFNPRTSPARIHEAIKRLRSWIGKNQFPLTVAELGGAYRLELEAGLSIKIPLHNPLQDITLSPFLRLLREYGQRAFGSLEAGRLLSLSQRATQRLISDLVTSGELIALGSTNRRRYRVKLKS